MEKDLTSEKMESNIKGNLVLGAFMVMESYCTQTKTSMKESLLTAKDKDLGQLSSQMDRLSKGFFVIILLMDGANLYTKVLS